MTRSPEPNLALGSLECRMQRFMAGRELAVVASISDDDPAVIVVTAIVLDKVNRMLKYDDAGLRNVWLANGYEMHDTAHGKAVSYHDIHGLTRAVCAALVDKPGPLSGAEFRYLRLHLRLSQVSLGTARRERTKHCVMGKARAHPAACRHTPAPVRD